MGPLIFLTFLICLANGLVCSKEEIYYGSEAALFCVNTVTGIIRVASELKMNQIPLPGFLGDLHAINEQIYFPGFIDLLNQSTVHLNPATEDWNKTGPGPTPPDVAIDWDDLLIDYERKLFYGTITWPIASMDTKRIFVFQNASEAPAVSVVNVSMPFCSPNCVGYSDSQTSSLDVDNNLLYLIQQEWFGFTWVMTVDLTKKALVQVSNQNYALFGIQTIEYNPTDGLIYGYLSQHDGNFLYNTSIITIDPVAGTFDTVVLLDLPGNASVPFPDTLVPYLVNLNLQQQRAYAIYGTASNTTSGCYFWELRTLSMKTGKVESAFPISKENCNGEFPAAPWGLSSMEYYSVD